MVTPPRRARGLKPTTCSELHREAETDEQPGRELREVPLHREALVVQLQQLRADDDRQWLSGGRISKPLGRVQVRGDQPGIDSHGHDLQPHVELLTEEVAVVLADGAHTDRHLRQGVRDTGDLAQPLQHGFVQLPAAEERAE
jgi:hypothetical protein